MKPIKQAKLFFVLSLFTILFVLFMFLPSWAATYYIDATKGNDNNSGLSQSTPWQTIYKVNNSKFLPGDNILFKRGDVWRKQLTVPSSGAPGKQILFGAWGQGERPVISGSNVIIDWQKEKENIWKTAFNGKPNQLFFNKKRGIKKENKQGLYKVKDWCFFSNIFYIYSKENPNFESNYLIIEVSIRDNCLNLNDKSYLSFKNIEFTHANSYYGGNIDNWENAGVSWGNIVIENCEISYAFGNGIRIQTENKGSVLDSLLITKCEIHDNGVGDNGYGIKIQSNKNVNTNYHKIQIGYNELYNNVQEGVRVQNTNSSKIYNNYAHDNGFGDSIDSGHLLFGNYTLNSEIYYNKCKNSPAEAIWIGTSNISNIKIYYNIIYDVDNYHGINISGVDTAEIYNNTIFDTNGGFAIGTDSRSTGIVLVNNIVDGLNGPNGNIESANSSTFTSDYNIWDENKIFYPDQIDRTWNYWKDNLQQDSNGHRKDPMLMNPEKGDFRLKSNSDCINSGKNTNTKFDLYGVSVPQGIKADIGALEFIQSIVTPKNFRILRY